MVLVLYILIIMQCIILNIYYVSDTILGTLEILFLNSVIELMFSWRETVSRLWCRSNTNLTDCIWIFEAMTGNEKSLLGLIICNCGLHGEFELWLKSWGDTESGAADCYPVTSLLEAQWKFCLKARSQQRISMAVTKGIPLKINLCKD